jgi:hypothetical protein
MVQITCHPLRWRWGRTRQRTLHDGLTSAYWLEIITDHWGAFSLMSWKIWREWDVYP